MARTPRLVLGGVKLRSQVDKRFPDRDKRSDGWIGDKAHQDRVSDHNPDLFGWVYAIDIDENMGKGVWRNGRNASRLANELAAYAASGLPGSNRLKYVVYEDRIASGTYKATWWKFRGKGYGHTAHIHVSFTGAALDDDSVWPLPILAMDSNTRRAWKAQLK